jgi:hypothetical protein
MKGMATPLSEEDMKHVAAFYASKQAKTGFAKNKDTVALGEKIYRGGIAERSIAGLRRLPQPQRRRHPGPVPAPGRPACRLHRGPAGGLPRRPAQATARR